MQRLGGSIWPRSFCRWKPLGWATSASFHLLIRRNPGPSAMHYAYSLDELGALQGGRLTDTGRLMARLPVDRKFGAYACCG